MMHCSDKQVPSVAEQYINGEYSLFVESNDSFYRYYVHDSLFRCVRELAPKKLLDVGCGNGILSRKLVDVFSTLHSVISVDLSSTMISCAKALTPANYSQIQYVHSDFEAFATEHEEESFDLIVSGFVLCHCGSFEEVKRFCCSLFRMLALGGTTAHIIPAQTVEKSCSTQQAVKADFSVTVDEKDIHFSLFDFYYSNDALVSAFASAGFRNIQCSKAEISQEGVALLGEEWKADMETRGMYYIITAEKH
jgi:2-polyprenyl-3-methyl-5-hydroxy-6-metoxy-1,4-benzoquinol methylase